MEDKIDFYQQFNIKRPERLDKAQENIDRSIVEFYEDQRPRFERMSDDEQVVVMAHLNQFST